MFKTTNLSGNRVLVAGTDKLGFSGRTVLDSTEWAELKATRAFQAAEDAFNLANEEFYAPITAAAEALEAAADAAKNAELEDIFYEELQTGEAAKAESPTVRQLLSKDSVILKLIETGAADDRLIWIGDDLEILAPATSGVSAVTFESEVSAVTFESEEF